MEFKITFLSTRSQSGWAVQLQEIRLLDSAGRPVPSASVRSVRNPNGRSPRAQGVGNLFDGDVSHSFGKFVDMNMADQGSSTILFTIEEAFLSAYEFVTANDNPSRALALACALACTVSWQ
jgi:hypothetical protein